MLRPFFNRFNNVAQGVGLALILNLMIKPAWLLTENAVQAVIGNQAYGLYAALLALSFMPAQLMDLGLSQHATRSIAFGDFNSKHQSELLVLKLWLSLLYGGVVLVLGYLTGYRDQAILLLIALIIYQVLLSFLTFGRALTQGYQWFKLDSISSVLDKLILFIIVVVLFYFDLINLKNFIYVNILSILIAVLVVFVLLKKKITLSLPTFSWDKTKVLLTSGLPFAILALLYTLNEKINPFMLERIAGADVNGVYAAAFRWIAAASMYLWTVLPIFYARFAKYKNDPIHIAQLLAMGQILVGLPMILVCGVMMTYPEIFFFQFKGDIAPYADNLRIQAIGLLLNSFFAIYSTYLTATGCERMVNKVLLVSIVVMVLFNLWVIPKWGAIGASWSQTAAFVMLCPAYWWLSKKRIQDMDASSRYLKLFLVLVAVFFMLGLSLFWGWFWLFGISLTALVWSLLLVTLRLQRYLYAHRS